MYKTKQFIFDKKWKITFIYSEPLYAWIMFLAKAIQPLDKRKKKCKIIHLLIDLIITILLKQL